MRMRSVLSFSFVAAAASISLPALLSAQSDVDELPVRITLLESGEIEIVGDFLLQTVRADAPYQVTSGRAIRSDDGSLELHDGITIVTHGFTVTADTVIVNSEAASAQMRGARISWAE